MLSGIHGYFNSAGKKNYDIYISRFPRDAAGFIPLYTKDLPENTVLRVYAVGGDGILFDCLNGLVNFENAELGAIPYGHTNNYIRGFGKNEKRFFRNIARQVDSVSIPMDILRCGSNYALNYCVIGLEAEAVRYSERLRDKMDMNNPFNQWLYNNFYNAYYISGGIFACFDKRIRRQKYEITVDGKVYSEDGWGFSIFNGPYYGGSWHPINDAKPNDGILDMHFILGRRFLHTYSKFPFYLSGSKKLIPKIIFPLRGEKIKIRSADILKVCLDDNTFYESELDVEILPGGIRFIDASQHGYRGICND